MSLVMENYMLYSLVLYGSESDFKTNIGLRVNFESRT